MTESDVDLRRARSKVAGLTRYRAEDDPELVAARQHLAALQSCGTTGGYQRHRKQGEEPCAPCTAASVRRKRDDRLHRRGVDPSSITHGTFSGGMVGCQCYECLQWRPVRHGTVGAYSDGCRCDACTQTKTRHVDRFRMKNPDRFARDVAKWQRRWLRENSESLSMAVNYGKQWTTSELEVVARTDLSAKEAAALLGRSLAGVNNARSRLRSDADAIHRGFTS